MNTITKFSRFKTNTFNGQDVLKNHFLSKNPIIYTNDTNDYSQAAAFYGKSDYVWLINHEINLLREFPLWIRPPADKTDVAYEFPYVYSSSNNIKSWGMVKLVPTTGIVNSVELRPEICGKYDIYQGKNRFDMFYIGPESDIMFGELSNKYTNIQAVTEIAQAFDLSTTDMFWIIPKDIVILDSFKFDLIPHERAYEYPHVFGNGEMDNHDGIVLMSKKYVPTKKELEYNFYVKKRIIKKIISIPA